MPIRFRCSQCDRLLGIARRKAGTQIRCPQCGELTTVPSEDAPPSTDQTLEGLDELLGPPSNGHAAVLAPPVPALAAPPHEADLDFFPPAPPRPKPAPKVRPKKPDDGLFEQDVDDLLGIEKIDEALLLDEPSKAKPVNGTDAKSLDDGPGTITLSSQRATLIVVAAVILMLVAFATGFAIRATI
jgi:phage FluMu protein Com